MIKTVVLVPVRDNDGRPFPKALWEELQARFMPFGGFTRPIGVVGAWQSGGRVYHDRSRQYTVVLASWRQLAAWLAVVEWAREAFRQEAMYVEVAGVPEILDGPGVASSERTR